MFFGPLLVYFSSLTLSNIAYSLNCGNDYGEIKINIFIKIVNKYFDTNFYQLPEAHSCKKNVDSPKRVPSHRVAKATTY